MADTTITRATHRHGGQREADEDLVIEVGKPPPDFYQRPGRLVRSIDGRDPLRCILDDGDLIFIEKNKVISIAGT